MQANRASKSDGNVGEHTPLLSASSSSSSTQSSSNNHKDNAKAGIAFHRVETCVRKKGGDSSVPVEPAQALTPLVTGGIIETTDGATLKRQYRPPPLPKSVPTAHPSKKTARHKSHFMNNLNNFRHHYKNTRLALKLGGMAVMANMTWDVMASYSPLKYNGKHGLEKMTKHIKRLGQGGSMRVLLKQLHPFTNALRLSMVVLRTMECAHSVRMQVGVEESMGYIGNRISHKVAKFSVDTFVAMALLPGSHYIFSHQLLPLAWWFPVLLCLIMGVARAVAPYALSFLGSRLGRVLTRQFFLNAHHKWLPVQRVEHFNAEAHKDKNETPENAPLFDLGRKVAMTLAKVQNATLDDGKLKQQNQSLAQQGFRLVGLGTGGYTVYESLITKNATTDSSSSSSTGDTLRPVLLHVTPYGPSMLDVLPHYLVLETENAQDRRGAFSETIAARRWAGPTMVEGFAYRGGFFTTHNFAEMKEAYNDVLKDYERACSAIPVNQSTGLADIPPLDKASLEKFLTTGAKRQQQLEKKNEDVALQQQVGDITKKLQSMMSNENGCLAPQGIILYLEGLSCSRKNSTGGLIVQALRDAGYQVKNRHYNTPPTEDEKSRQWMDRFDVPDTTSLLHDDGGESGESDGRQNDASKGQCADGDHHVAMVWKRGPAGDFVFGELGDAPDSEKGDRYLEFKEFDHGCFKNSILFIKLLFVTNQDSISSLIGRRLGEQSAIQDLHKWLTASYGADKANEVLSGFDMRDMFNDPTDFIAINEYWDTLSEFADFALKTDNECNPWLVVDTTDHFLAGTQLLCVFDSQIDAYSRVKLQATTGISWFKDLLYPSDEAKSSDGGFGSFGIYVSMGIVKAKQRMKMGYVIALSLVLIYLYLFWLD